ncbi:unnamed protein product, partial [Nesidiocoris tenuis]
MTTKPSGVHNPPLSHVRTAHAQHPASPFSPDRILRPFSCRGRFSIEPQTFPSMVSIPRAYGRPSRLHFFIKTRISPTLGSSGRTWDEEESLV